MGRRNAKLAPFYGKQELKSLAMARAVRERCPGKVLAEYSQTDSSRRSIAESTHWMVLHRPVALAQVTGDLDSDRFRHYLLHVS
jgi:hypothetical protein